jgi:hypothetical protein
MAEITACKQAVFSETPEKPKQEGSKEPYPKP